MHPPKPLPADSLGQCLHHIFGRHLWDFLEAPAPAPGEKPQWRTVTHYQMRPRILWQRWQDPQTLIGVRFNSQTLYGLLDIDANSPYCNAASLAEIRAALETLGIVRTLLIRSSHSGGLHLYIPLPEPVKTFDLAVALHECLTAQGFQFTSGQLEQFPNVKTYGNERIVHYNGHRLPLQPDSGSCLLNDDLNPIGDRLDHFLRHWDHAASHQAMDELRHALKIGRDNHRKKPRRSLYPSSTVAVWQQDLETEINEGWSGPGQTNHLLKTIACHGHVFLHLQADQLIQHTLDTAQQLPGYQQHCCHQHHLATRVTAWCKAVEKYYWPLGDAPKRNTSDQPPQPSVNQQRAEDARDRIQQAINTLKQLGTLPRKIRDLAQQLAETAHCSLKTVYKHLTLWHPAHQPPEETCVTAQPAGNSALLESPEPSQSAQPSPPPDPPEPLSDGLLHTQEKFMKCKAVSCPSQKNPLQRGVWGETSDRFPQIGTSVSVSGVSDGLNHDPPYRPLPLPPSSASPEEWECYRNQEAMRRCLFRLKWSHAQLTQFIAEQFDGKRFYQLVPDEVLLLIYCLQNLSST